MEGNFRTHGKNTRYVRERPTIRRRISYTNETRCGSWDDDYCMQEECHHTAKSHFVHESIQRKSLNIIEPNDVSQTDEVNASDTTHQDSDESESECESDFSEYDESFVVDENRMSEILRQKAHSIIEHNKRLSKDRVDANDAINLVYIHLQAGNFDFDCDPEDLQDHFCFEVDEATKRVSHLLVRTSDIVPRYFPIDMISSLNKLEVLKLSNINVSSPHVAKEIECSSLLLRRESFRNLKKLDISYSKIIGNVASLETRLFHLLPSLESITFRLFTGRPEIMYIRNVLNDIQSGFCACQKTLSNIDLSQSMCTQEVLKTILLDVAPKLPNLIRVNMSGNKIESLKKIADDINMIQNFTTGYVQCQNSLQVLDLSWNAVMSKIDSDDEERVALMTILRTFKGLYSLGNNISIKKYPPDVEYQLRMNHSGRRLIETSHHYHKPIPANLLPIILERAFQKSRDIYPLHWRDEQKNDPTGIYYLCRSGVILQSILSHRLAENRRAHHGARKSNKRQKIDLSGSSKLYLLQSTLTHGTHHDVTV